MYPPSSTYLSISHDRAGARGAYVDGSYHCLRLDLCDEVAHDLAFVLADIHEVLLRPAILVNGLQDFGGVATDLVDVGSAVNGVQELDFAAVVEEDFLLLGIRFALVEFWHFEFWMLNATATSSKPLPPSECLSLYVRLSSQ